MAMWSDELAEFSKQAWADFQQHYLPLQQAQIADYQNYNTVSKAMTDAAKARTILGSVADRNQSRLGAVLPAAHRANDQKQRRLGNVLDMVGAGNNAALSDIDTRQRMAEGINAQGAMLRDQANAGYGAAAGMEAGRIQAYNASKSQTRGLGMGLAGAGVGVLATLLKV